MSDDLELVRKRALYRAGHRGTKELDWLLGKFASERVPGMAADELAAFEQFLDLPDPSLQGWIMGKEADCDPQWLVLIQQLKDFHRL